MPSATPLTLFLGASSNTPGLARGIHALRLDPASGALTEPVLAAATPNPGFLALHPNGQVLYASGEAGQISEKVAAGAVNAYTVEARAGRLSRLGQQPTGGLSVTHLAADATGRALVTASYHGGQVAAFPLDRDGRPGPRSASIQHSGPLGPNRARQDKPHPHSVTISPDNRFAQVCDLGLDLVVTYRLEPGEATLSAAGLCPAARGSGPRHSKFSRDGRFLYVINELASTIVVHRHDPATGLLRPQQTASCLPPDFTGESICAEIHLHPNGRFVYGANRGHDSLAVFARDPDEGGLELVEIVPCGGRHPRHFALSPDGAWLVCANRDTNSVTVLRVDADSGRLTATPHQAALPTPTCVLFCPAT